MGNVKPVKRDDGAGTKVDPVQMLLSGLILYDQAETQISNDIMTDQEKLNRMKKLGQAMYDAAQYLTTDASRLRKAMEEWHQFIIYEL